ncbi:hypothetical protein ACL02U_28630 [Streptomyces sp. MS06]|uniref:SCO2584 family spore wall biosynthesis protein n=1 Tax=Streptomyces sp. MS06 TaxID=3385974 RepID=UPI0039A34BA5
MTPQVYSGHVPEDVGGTPFPDGWEPDDDHDRGVSDEEFASVVFDEAFVQAATVHEPTAVERLLAAAQARAEASEAEARRARGRRYGGYRTDDHLVGPEVGYDDPDDAGFGHGALGGYAGPARWHRPVAWLLALVMGVGMVALAFSAVYRGASSSGERDQSPPPASTSPGQGGAVPVPSSDPVDRTGPPVPAGPPTP